MGNTLKNQGELEEAIKFFNKALALSLIMLKLITIWEMY